MPSLNAKTQNKDRKKATQAYTIERRSLDTKALTISFALGVGVAAIMGHVAMS